MPLGEENPPAARPTATSSIRVVPSYSLLLLLLKAVNLRCPRCPCLQSAAFTVNQAPRSFPPSVPSISSSRQRGPCYYSRRSNLRCATVVFSCRRSLPFPLSTLTSSPSKHGFSYLHSRIQTHDKIIQLNLRD
ncbi:unnamed protein product [Linum trigynum]|uniref:Uncharacterized protein n=1 Tax=Linum trigynum TaxID=586398 RepID=A0AAV2GB67_9ROSI